MFCFNLWLMIFILISIVKVAKNETYLNTSLTDSYPGELTAGLPDLENATEQANESEICEEAISKGLDACDRNDSISNLTSSLERLILPDIQEYHNRLAEHVTRIFCSIQTIFLYIYLDINVSGAWANIIVRDLNECSSDGVIVVR